MEFRQLKTFVATVKYSSFTKAADHLGYAQSTITGRAPRVTLQLRFFMKNRWQSSRRPTIPWLGSAKCCPGTSMIRRWF